MTQPNLLELAKQGDAQAIASLMNRQLQPKGITAKVALKDACLQMMLESAQVPNQQALVAFIRKGITGLGAASIERVKVYDALTQQGYLQFSIQVGIESKGGVFAAVRDENTVIFHEFEQLEFEEVKRYVNSVIDADPIDFDKLRFLELKELKELRIKEGAKKLRASREAVLTKKKKKPLTTMVKLLIGACFILFVFVLLTPQGSVFNTLSGSVLLIISLVFLCMALIKPD